MEELLNKIGQLQYEISILDIDEERLTGVDIRTEELKELIKQGQLLPIDNVSNKRQLLIDAFNWYRTTDLNVEGYPSNDLADKYKEDNL